MGVKVSDTWRGDLTAMVPDVMSTGMTPTLDDEASDIMRDSVKAKIGGRTHFGRPTNLGVEASDTADISVASA